MMILDGANPTCINRIVNCANALARYYYAIDIPAAKLIANSQLLALEKDIRSLDLDQFNQDGLSIKPGAREFHFLHLKRWLKEQHNCPQCESERLAVTEKGDLWCQGCHYSNDDDLETG